MKAICIMNDHPDLKAYVDRFQNNVKAFEERKAFIEKQIFVNAERAQKEHDKIWAELEGALRSKGLLPADYDKDKHQLELNKETSVLTMDEIKPKKDIHSLEELFRKIFESSLGDKPKKPKK